MKIVYLASSAVPSLAANSVHVMKMAQALAVNGHEVLLVTPEYNRLEPAPCGFGDMYAYYHVSPVFSVHRTPGRIKGKVGLPFHLYDVYRTVKAFKPDVIYARCFFSACLLAALGWPVILERHDGLARGSLSARLMNWLVQQESFKALIVISHALKAHLAAEFPVPSEKIFVAPDGADRLDLTTITPRSLPGVGPHIGYIGHLYQGRGIDLILELVKRTPDVHFHLVGGRNEDVAYWQGQAAGLTNVIFYGHLAHCEAVTYLPSFDILLAPYQEKVSVSRGGNTAAWMSPLKIFEYMSAGKAIIASDLPVLHDVMTPGENCLLCPPGDMAVWHDALMRLLLDQTLKNAIGAKAQADFLEHYTWQSRAQKVLDFVRAL